MKNIGTLILEISLMGLCLRIKNNFLYSYRILYFTYSSKFSMADSTMNLGNSGTFLSAKKWIVF